MSISSLLPKILEKLDEHKNHLLQVAAVGMADSQFKAYRTIVLDTLGRNGFQQDLEKILAQHTEWNGAGRNTQARKEVPNE